ncbi:MAG: FecR domain-containing protein [Chitinophagaceae bacterium]|nr:FecR domain-containing protein [Chitinophagaceae bacterium]
MGSKNLTRRQLSRLAQKYIAGTATAEEAALLHEWYDTIDPGHTETVLVSTPVSSAEMSEEIFASLQQKIEKEKNKVLILPHRHFHRVYAAAAAILVLIAGAALWYLLSAPVKKESPQFVKEASKEVPAPQAARAVITLASGERLYLDSLSDGPIAVEGSTRVLKKNNGIVYEATPNTDEVQYNVINVPRASRVVNLTLSDGTRVWLNAESSLRYPVAFTGNTRNVEITGEAYFEVSKDPKRQFNVSSRGLTTAVLGTSFNVNTYADEPSMKVTLLEGSVLVNYRNGEKLMLKPGEQARLNSSSSLNLEKDVDTEAVIAWKNEHFMMKGMDMGALARQMARWYNVEIVFGSKIPDREFGGSISRNVSLSTMLKALQESGIDCYIENRKVIIQ